MAAKRRASCCRTFCVEVAGPDCSASGWADFRHGLHPRTGYGFYTVSRDGKQVVSSRLAKDLPLQWTMQQTRLLRFQWNANGTALYLQAILNEVQNVWRVRVNPTTLEWVSAERLTTGSGPDAAAALSHDGTR